MRISVFNWNAIGSVLGAPHRFELISLPARPYGGLVVATWFEMPKDSKVVSRRVAYSYTFSGFDWNRRSPASDVLKQIMKASGVDVSRLPFKGFPDLVVLNHAVTAPVSVFTLQQIEGSSHWKMYIFFFVFLEEEMFRCGHKGKRREKTYVKEKKNVHTKGVPRSL